MKDKKQSGSKEEIFLSVIFFFLTALTVVVAVIRLLLLGVLESDMKYTWLYIVLFGIFSVTLYSFIYSVHIKKRSKDADKICEYAQKIEDGIYDFSVNDLTGEYAIIGEKLQKVAKCLQTTENAITDFINDFS
ncbi:MAG: hypothetical protein MJ072_06855, partial [Clostridia bacterium]|nr:hypothetical protein [Clostridia bacterium]